MRISKRGEYALHALILDKYSLKDIVEITLRKMRRDRVPMPFVIKMPGSETDRQAGQAGRIKGSAVLESLIFKAFAGFTFSSNKRSGHP